MKAYYDGKYKQYVIQVEGWDEFGQRETTRHIMTLEEVTALRNEINAALTEGASATWRAALNEYGVEPEERLAVTPEFLALLHARDWPEHWYPRWDTADYVKVNGAAHNQTITVDVPDSDFGFITTGMVPVDMALRMKATYKERNHA